LEYVILSHLKELQCTERIKPGHKETKAGKKDEATIRKEFTDRRGHKRTLPPGHVYSQTQYKEALLEQGWDLAEINMINDRTKETGMITYVKIQESVRVGGPPIVSTAPHAMDTFKQIVGEQKQPEDREK